MSSHFNSGIQCLSLIARFHQIPAETSALLLREYQHNNTNEDKAFLADINLIRAAKSLGFKAKFITDTADKITAHVLPAIARHVDRNLADISADVIEHEQLGLLFPLKALYKQTK